ncbi:MAG: glycosyltransferase family 4 protein [Ignavibacteria bacterium]
MNKILHISPCFNYNCGRSKLVYLYLSYFKSKSSYEIHFITNGGDSLERLREIQIDYKILNFSSGLKNIFFQKIFYNQLKEYLIKNEIQLIHTHHRFPEYISIKAAKELNIRTVASAHSFVKGYKKISFKSDKIIAVSNSMNSYLQKEFKIEKERIITLYSPAVDFTAFNEAELMNKKKELGLSCANRIILFMGRINFEKGYDVLLKSFQAVKNEFKNAMLLLCGKIEDKNFYKLSEKLNNSVKVFQPRSNMKLFYGIADLVVLPSRIDPFPFVMIEAGSFKKTFIGGNTGGISEFIADGKDGLLVQPGDPDELAEKIIYLLKNEAHAQTLGENLYKKVKEQCDYNNYFLRVENIYDSLLSQ